MSKGTYRLFIGQCAMWTINCKLVLGCILNAPNGLTWTPKLSDILIMRATSSAATYSSMRCPILRCVHLYQGVLLSLWIRSKSGGIEHVILNYMLSFNEVKHLRLSYLSPVCHAMDFWTKFV